MQSAAASIFTVTSFSREVNGMANWPSVVKLQFIGIEISPTTPLILTRGGGKSVKFGVVFKITQLCARARPRLKMQQDRPTKILYPNRLFLSSLIRTLKQKCNAAMIARCPMSSPSLVKLCPRLHHPWESSHQLCPPPKIARENVLNRQ